MIRYSHVCLLVPCEEASAARVTELLAVQPSMIQKSQSSILKGDGMVEQTSYSWQLHSSLGHQDGDAAARLFALAEQIETFEDRLPALQSEFRAWIDMLYHTTAQHPHGINGEFDWLVMPATLMCKFGKWNLDISYEVFWFDHPDWVRPWSFWKRLFG